MDDLDILNQNPNVLDESQLLGLIGNIEYIRYRLSSLETDAVKELDDRRNDG